MKASRLAPTLDDVVFYYAAMTIMNEFTVGRFQMWLQFGQEVGAA